MEDGGCPQDVVLYASSDEYSSPLHNQTTLPQGGGPMKAICIFTFKFFLI